MIVAGCLTSASYNAHTHSISFIFDCQILLLFIFFIFIFLFIFFLFHFYDWLIQRITIIIFKKTIRTRTSKHEGGKHPTNTAKFQFNFSYKGSPTPYKHALKKLVFENRQ